MKIINSAQTKELDNYTINSEPIPSIDLMERAALHCTNWIIERYNSSTEIVIFCGLGNNGGDGLAIARLLAEKGFKVQVFVMRYSENYSADFATNFERLKLVSNNNLSITETSTTNIEFNHFLNSEQYIIVDALIGAGLKDAAKGLVQECIQLINKTSFPVISIDIPSGLMSHKSNNPKDSIVKANYTLTFQLPKLSFMFIETSLFVGEFSIFDIGLDKEYINELPSNYYFVTKNDVQSFLKTRNKVAHKGDFGHALIIAGSQGKVGAAALASKACLRSGVGLLTIHSPKCGYEILQNFVPEAMVSIDDEKGYVSTSINIENFDAIGIGPGIGTINETAKLLKLLIQNSMTPLVIDADAINIISENPTWLSFIPKDSIFTPHLKEFERLAGKTSNSFERIELQREFSIKNAVYVILKGAHSSISCPNGDMYFNSTGNPGMATAGSGDVLTGIITGLMAQDYSSMQSCILGTYIHGLAGDLATHEKTEESVITSDIIENLSGAFKFLKS